MNITFINRMMGIKFGGGENFDLNIALALRNRGHNIRFVIGREWKRLALPMDENKFNVVYIKTPYLRDIHYKIKPTNIIKKIISVGALELDLYLFENAVFKYLKNDTWTDIYQICGLPRLGALFGGQYATKQPLKTAVRWPGPPNMRKLKYMKKCDVNFANGDAFKQIQSKLLKEVREVNLGIDIKEFFPAKKNSSKMVRFLFVGRIVPIKNLPFLIKGFNKALKQNKNIELNIVGDGLSKELELIKKIANQNKNIYFLGKKNRAEIIKQYQNNDVFILTSNYDNYPNVIFEAMSSGLPVIATNVGGIALQVVDQETGILVDLNDTEQLSNAILELASDAGKREQMGKAGRARVEKEFTWEKSAEQLENIYKEIFI